MEDLKVPKAAWAVQLTGPDQLKLNQNKPVARPGSYQVIARVQAVGLCFSDLKLLKQFSTHARKTEIVDGIEKEVLNEIASYVPGETPAVPGHEAVVQVVEIGQKVKGVRLGGRYLVQTDYRWLPTKASNAAFGYNFEGGLQEYVLMDQRVITSPDGNSMLLDASEDLSAAAVALVEPWACVENAYAVQDRQTLKKGGRMLLLAEAKVDEKKFDAYLTRYGQPGEIVRMTSDSLDEAAAEAFDDVLYFGHDAAVVEKLFSKIAAQGLLNIVLCDGKLAREVVAKVGRVHYGGIRIIGTVTDDPADSMAVIPATGEIRQGDRIDVVGAAGAMGAMHVIRCLCQGVKGVMVYAGDLSDERLAVLDAIAKGLAQKNNVAYQSYNPGRGESAAADPDYIVLMAPVMKLVADAVKRGAEGAILNIFAGIPASVEGAIDLQRYIEKKMYFIGTSGSRLEDMKVVLAKVEKGRLDTNFSVAAVSGLKGAIDGIRAVEKQEIAGKIVVYPACRELPLLRLEELSKVVPEAGAAMKNGLWNVDAEKKLLEHFCC